MPATVAAPIQKTCPDIYPALYQGLSDKYPVLHYKYTETKLRNLLLCAGKSTCANKAQVNLQLF